VCIRIAADFLSISLPERAAVVKEEFFSAVQIYLLIMEGTMLNDETASISALGVDLVFHSDRMVKILSSPWKRQIDDNELKVCWHA